MNLAAAPPSIQECGLWKKTSPASELEKGWDQGGVRLGKLLWNLSPRPTGQASPYA